MLFAPGQVDEIEDVAAREAIKALQLRQAAVDRQKRFDVARAAREEAASVSPDPAPPPIRMLPTCPNCGREFPNRRGIHLHARACRG